MLKRQFQELIHVVGNFKDVDQLQADDARKTREAKQRAILPEGEVDDLTRHN